MSILELLSLIAACCTAVAVNAVAGGGTLLTFPVLPVVISGVFFGAGIGILMLASFGFRKPPVERNEQPHSSDVSEW